MSTFKRCTVPHWQGNTFIDVGTVRPAGHPQVIDAYFEDLDVDEPAVEPVKSEPKSKAKTEDA